MSKLRANQLTDKASTGAPTAPNGLVVTGVTTSTTFSGSGSGLTGLTDSQIPNLNASKITAGTLPTTRGGTGRADAQRIAGAWCTYKSDGTPSIYDSYNVTSVTDNTAGAQTVNFTNACANSDYSVAGTATYPSGTNFHFITLGSRGGGMNDSALATGSCKIWINYIDGNQNQDVRRVTTIFFGDWS